MQAEVLIKAARKREGKWPDAVAMRSAPIMYACDGYPELRPVVLDGHRCSPTRTRTAASPEPRTPNAKPKRKPQTRNASARRKSSPQDQTRTLALTLTLALALTLTLTLALAPAPTLTLALTLAPTTAPGQRRAWQRRSRCSRGATP